LKKRLTKKRLKTRHKSPRKGAFWFGCGIMDSMKKPMLFVNEITGDIVTVRSNQEALRLPKEYHRLEFTKNEDGKAVARFKIRSADGKGYATVDISENELGEVAHGNAGAK
jgi:hypothetical protein